MKVPVTMVGEARVYEVDGRRYGTVSPDAMAYIIASAKVCKSDEPLELLRIAAVSAQGNDRILTNLYTYGRFEFDIHPRDLGEIFRPLMKDPKLLAEAIAKVCPSAVNYFRKTGTGHRKH